MQRIINVTNPELVLFIKHVLALLGFPCVDVLDISCIRHLQGIYGMGHVTSLNEHLCSAC